MSNNYSQEITELHQFFQDYFRGKIPFEAISRFDQSLGAAFTLIDSTGRITEYDEIKQVIRQLHGKRQAIHIWVENILLRHSTDDLIVATYEEWQNSDGKSTQRYCSVIFKKDADAPNGLVWLHVHESGLHELS
jgi:hypothetical protein